MPPHGENLGFLAKFLAAQLTADRIKFWRRVFFGALILVAALSLVIANHHPHFGYDQYPLFWSVFGALVGLAMVLLVKKIIQPMIKRSEDYYGDL
ncbi:MAG: hypothetical protein LBT86_10105 [Deltaproteobacteria bacterium]|jgi:hypothetical protein|nr:hypothetical protein [Deltaproteobacteria bacterium]